MNHDNLVRAISTLFPKLTTSPPSGRPAPRTQTSFWIPGLAHDDGRVVRVDASGRLKRAATARYRKDDPLAAIDSQFHGDLDELRALVMAEIEAIVLATGTAFPAVLETSAAKELHPRAASGETEGGGPEQAQRGREARDWTDEELRATVESYGDMLLLIKAGKPHTKSSYYKKLSEQFGRVPGAFERRMQNISHLLEARGLDWVPGLKPQRNVGANVEPRLLRFLQPLIEQMAQERSYPDELPALETFVEGARKQVTVNAYERDVRARDRCIRKWGAVCAVCSFDFGGAYGELGSGFIHVHHLRPLHTIGEAYELNPEQDLAPVCPNCHAMLHRGKTTLSIEELKARLKWRFAPLPSDG